MISIDPLISSLKGMFITEGLNFILKSLVLKGRSSLIDVGYCEVESVLAFSMTGPTYES